MISDINNKNTYENKDKQNSNFNETLKELYYSLKTSNMRNFTDYNNEILRTESDDNNNNAMKTISTVNTVSHNNYYQQPFTNIESGLEDDIKIDKKRSLFKNMKSNEIMIEDNNQVNEIIENRKFSLHSNVFNNNILKSPMSNKNDFIKRKGTELSLSNNRKKSVSNFSQFMEEENQNKKKKKMNKINSNKKDITDIVPEFKADNANSKKSKKNHSISKNSKDNSLSISSSESSLSSKNNKEKLYLKTNNHSNLKTISEKIKESKNYLDNVELIKKQKYYNNREIDVDNMEKSKMINSKIPVSTIKILDNYLNNFTNKQNYLQVNTEGNEFINNDIGTNSVSNSNSNNNFILHTNVNLERTNDNKSKKSNFQSKFNNFKYQNQQQIQFSPSNNDIRNNTNLNSLSNKLKYDVGMGVKSKSKYIVESKNESNFLLPEIDKIKFYRKNLSLLKNKKKINMQKNNIINLHNDVIIDNLQTISSFGNQTKYKDVNLKEKGKVLQTEQINNINKNTNENRMFISKNVNNRKSTKNDNIEINNQLDLNKIEKLKTDVSIKKNNDIDHLNNNGRVIKKSISKIPNIFIYDKELWTENKKDNVRKVYLD